MTCSAIKHVFFPDDSCYCSFLAAQSGPVHRRIAVEVSASALAADRGLADPLPEPIPSQGVLPLAIGIIPPLQMPLETWDIAGIRLNLLAGRHNNVAVIDIGTIANLSLGEVTGIEVAGLWNQVNQNFMGLQVSGIANRVCGDTTGLQVSGIANYNGVGETIGLQIAPVNVNQGESTGVQIGIYNQAEIMSGVQIGIFNIAENFNGMQLVLCNLIKKSPVPFMVIFNFGF